MVARNSFIGERIRLSKYNEIPQESLLESRGGTSSAIGEYLKVPLW